MLNRLRKAWRKFWRNPHHEYFEYIRYYDVFNDDGKPLMYHEWIKDQTDYWLIINIIISNFVSDLVSVLAEELAVLVIL